MGSSPCGTCATTGAATTTVIRQRISHEVRRHIYAAIRFIIVFCSGTGCDQGRFPRCRPEGHVSRALETLCVGTSYSFRDVCVYGQTVTVSIEVAATPVEQFQLAQYRECSARSRS